MNAADTDEEDGGAIGPITGVLEMEHERPQTLASQLDKYAQQFPMLEERNLGFFLSLSCMPDTMISGSMFFVAFLHGYRDTGVSLYCMGIQCMAHGVSSFLLILRFLTEHEVPAFPNQKTASLLTDTRRKSLWREQILSRLMCGAMLLSSIGCFLKAFRKAYYWGDWFLDHQNLEKDVEWATRFLAWYGSFVYSAHALVRGYVYFKLRRNIVWQGFSTSMITVAFLCILGVAAGYEHELSWKVEPCIAMVLACATLFEACHLLRLHHYEVEERLVDDPQA